MNQKLQVLNNFLKKGGRDQQLNVVYKRGDGAAIFVYIVLPNSQQSPNGEPKVSHVHAKHQLFLFVCLG